MWLNGLQNTFFFLRRDRCEKGVMSSVNVRNCIRFYQTAEELNATTLMNYCGEIIASHWVSTVGQCLYVANKATLGVFVCACGWMIIGEMLALKILHYQTKLMCSLDYVITLHTYIYRSESNLDLSFLIPKLSVKSQCTDVI